MNRDSQACLSPIPAKTILQCFCFLITKASKSFLWIPWEAATYFPRRDTMLNCGREFWQEFASHLCALQLFFLSRNFPVQLQCCPTFDEGHETHWLLMAVLNILICIPPHQDTQRDSATEGRSSWGEGEARLSVNL